MVSVNLMNCIKQLLNLCNVDNENVEIFFERKKAPKVNESDNKADTTFYLQIIYALVNLY